MTSKAASGQCRCCLSSGYYEDIAEYRQKFLDCYNLQLSTNTSLTNNICLFCISRLNDACEFKAMVVESEGKLLSKINTTSNIEFVNVTQYNIAQEEEQEEDIVKIKQEEDINYNKEQEGNIVSTKEVNDEEIQDTNNKTIATEQDRTKMKDRIIYQEDDINSDEEREEADVAIKEEAEECCNDDQYEEMDTKSDVDDQETEPSNTTHPVESSTPSTKELTLKNWTSKKHETVKLVAGDMVLLSPSKHTNKHVLGKSEKTKVNIESNGPVDLNKTKSNNLSIVTCKESFDVKSNECQANLTQGKKTVNLASEYACNLCKFTTNKNNVLETHIKAHSAAKYYVCDTCSFIAIARSSFITHMRIHTGEKPFACKICNKKFSQKCTLNVHSRIHTGEKPYVCKICNKFFSHSGALNSHVRHHTGEKPYFCKICDKTFKSKLSRHVKTHLKLNENREEYAIRNSQTFFCDTCDKKFAQRHDYNRHIKIHTNPYACMLCDHKFARKDHLNRHVKTHTGEKPYECAICHKKFTRSRDLKRHNSKFH